MEHKQNGACAATVHLFVARIPRGCTPTTVYPPERDAYIRAARNEQLRVQRYAVWRLLAYALEHTYGVHMEDAALARDASGRWTSGVCELSLSHTDGAAAVALSTHPVGVDIECADGLDSSRMARIEQRFLTDAERSALAHLSGDERARATLCLWTAKEASFKARHRSTFSPSLTEACDTYSREVTLADTSFFVSASVDAGGVFECALEVVHDIK